MKKTISIMLFLVAICLNVDAQGTSNVPEGEQYKNGFDMSYQAIEHGFGMGIGWVFSPVVINASFISGDTNKYVTKNEGWRVGLGGNYRFWIAKPLFIEAQAGVEYTHVTLETKVNGQKDKNSEGNFGMFLTPRIGLKLFKLWDANMGIIAGYRWDFNKFKFDKDYTDKYFTIGICAVM